MVPQALFVALLFAVASATTRPPPIIISQPVPWLPRSTTTGLYDVTYPNCTALTAAEVPCRYPFPQKALPSTTATCVNGVWVVNGDIIVPENTLVDLCSGLLRIEGNLYVPRSSNVSLFRAANGTAAVVGPRDGQVRVGGAVSVAGWTLIVINNSTNPNANFPPVDNTVYSNLYVVNTTRVIPWGFQMSNLTQFWQNARPGVPCQTIGKKVLVVFTPGNASASASLYQGTYSLSTTWFNQCVYDWTIFVGVVAGVGGAIILGTIVFFVVFVVKSVYDSVNKPVVGVVYQEMDRDD